MSTLQAQVRKTYGRSEFMLHERLQFDLQGRIATDLVTRWGIVAAVPEGEDTAGRQAMRLMTPQELVDRAMETAELLVRAAKDRGLTLYLEELPPPDEKD